MVVRGRLGFRLSLPLLTLESPRSVVVSVSERYSNLATRHAARRWLSCGEFLDVHMVKTSAIAVANSWLRVNQKPLRK